MCHWIVTATKAPKAPEVGLNLATPIVAANDDKDHWDVHELVEYLPPTPPPKTGLHRYVFVLLMPEKGHSGDDLNVPKDRPHWGKRHSWIVAESCIHADDLSLRLQ